MAAFGFPCNPEIISIHIPKTAGSSFHAALKKAYGWRLKHIHRQEDIRRLSTGKRFYSNKPFVLALHGHIRPHENWKRQYKKAQWVCWLRDPAERVVSAYYHLKKTQDLGDRNQALFKRLQPSLEEFLIHPDFKPVTRIYQHFLAKVTPNDFAFIGRTENYTEDLKTLSEILDKPLEEFKTNIGSEKRPISTAELNMLNDHLAAEYEVYSQFLTHFHS